MKKNIDREILDLLTMVALLGHAHGKQGIDSPPPASAGATAGMVYSLSHIAGRGRVPQKESAILVADLVMAEATGEGKDAAMMAVCEFGANHAPAPLCDLFAMLADDYRADMAKAS